jgi:annexin A7/11
VSHEVEVLVKAMKGFGTDELALIRVLAEPDPLQIALIRTTYNQKTGKKLDVEIAKEVNGEFEEALLAIVRGPLDNDVHLLLTSMSGMGTKETVLIDVLLSRSNADINAIKTEYQKKTRRSLEADLKGDLSGKTERLFMMAIAASRQEESAPVIPQQIEHDVSELHKATEGQMGTDEVSVIAILTNRSNGQIRAIVQAYEQKYRIPLEKVIEKVFDPKSTTFPGNLLVSVY